MYSIVHPFGGDEAAKHAWMRGFYEAAKAEGQVVSVEFTAETFFIKELDEVAPGAACSVAWDIDNCLCVANESSSTRTSKLNHASFRRRHCSMTGPVRHPRP